MAIITRTVPAKKLAPPGSLIGGMGYWGGGRLTPQTPSPKRATPTTVESLAQATNKWVAIELSSQCKATPTYKWIVLNMYYYNFGIQK